MRELGERVGMRAASLYQYVESKNAIYDLMFADGYTAFLRAMQAPAEGDPRDRLRHLAHAYVAFCTEDPVRYQLMFQRTIPDFVPSSESYALAVEALDRLASDLAQVGATTTRDVDLVTAVMTGLTSQQISNDPGGRRWIDLVDPAVDMLLATFSALPDAPARAVRRSRKDTP
jgi:AcrR family transcriptional regulator